MSEYIQAQFAGAFHVMCLTAFVLIPLFLVELVSSAQPLRLPTMAFNLIYAPLFLIMTGVLLQPMVSYLEPHLVHPLLGGEPLTWPLWRVAISIVAYLVAFDFFYYWMHRAQHRFPFLWRFHRFHHSDPSISATSSFRHHWLEEVFRYFAIAIPLLVLFNSDGELAPYLGLSMGAFGLFIHSNTRLGLGPLTHIIVGPRYHRIHHSMAPEQIDKNFATFFPFWDRLFGTQFMPVPGENPQTGIKGQAHPNALNQLSVFPPR